MATAAEMVDLVSRLQILETGLNERCQRLETTVSEQQTEIQRLVIQVARQREDSRTLVEDLQRKFEEQGATVEELGRATAALRAAQASASAAASGGSGPGAGVAGVVDTRTLGKPDHFSGKAEAWKDWSLVFYGYCGAVDARLEELMRGRLADGVSLQIYHDILR